MNLDRVEGNWHQLKGTVQQQWGWLTDDQLQVLAGQCDQLAGRIQERLGVSRDEQKDQLKNWNKRLKASNNFR